MAFISRPLPKAQPFTVAPHGGHTSIINEGLSIVGNVKSPGELHIDGDVEGAVECGSLFLGEEAKVQGDVTAEDVTVKGGLTGSIRARRVVLCSTSTVEGEIFYHHLTIEQGAYFEGLSRRSDNPLLYERSPRKPAVAGSQSA
jgi:cytoskeletal protein CcmA (bactofilin family)